MSLNILQISDTHLGADPSFEIAPGNHPWLRSQAVAQAVHRWISVEKIPVDFIVHTGDIVHRGHIPSDDGEGTRRSIALFQSLPRPIHWVIGNHDNRTAIRECLRPMPGTPLTADQDRWAYHFILRGERIAILDARGPLEYDPQGEIADDQLASLSNLLAATLEPINIFLHYPPISMGCDWIDRTMLIRNGDLLHELLRPHRQRVRGVFFGHIHSPTFTLRDGIVYASCGSSAVHLPNWPTADAAIPSSEPVAIVQYIQITQDGVSIKPKWVFLSPPESRS
jgi:3',5'-cyclic-AMP phosphodiesterase